MRIGVLAEDKIISKDKGLIVTIHEFIGKNNILEIPGKSVWFFDIGVFYILMFLEVFYSLVEIISLITSLC
jgi:hypothetical protein